MKHYRNTLGEVYAYEIDGSQDRLIPEDLTLMSDAEVAAHNNPAPPLLTPAQQLGRLDVENAFTQRHLREFIVETAEALKRAGVADLTALPSVKKAKEVEVAATALRGRL